MCLRDGKKVPGGSRVKEGKQQKEEGMGGTDGVGFGGEDSYDPLMSYQDHPGCWTENRLERCQGQSRKKSSELLPH